MNKLLQQTLAAVEKLPDAQQEAAASNILNDLEAEKGWDQRFSKSQDRLSELSRQAGKHIAEGNTLPFDPSDRPAR
jgi:hypothetical protein